MDSCSVPPNPVSPVRVPAWRLDAPAEAGVCDGATGLLPANRAKDAGTRFGEGRAG